MKIIAFTGMPASGKSEAVQLAKDKGIPVIRMGDLVWEETKRQGKPLNDKNVGSVASNMRKEHGMDVWAKRTVEKIHSLKKSSSSCHRRCTQHGGNRVFQKRARVGFFGCCD